MAAMIIERLPKALCQGMATEGDMGGGERKRQRMELERDNVLGTRH